MTFSTLFYLFFELKRPLFNHRISSLCIEYHGCSGAPYHGIVYDGRLQRVGLILTAEPGKLVARLSTYSLLPTKKPGFDASPRQRKFGGYLRGWRK